MNISLEVPLLGKQMVVVPFAKSSPHGWIGVDLDGTLAYHETGNQNMNFIGAPIPAMVDRVKGWLAEGKEVRIFTARVAEDFSGTIIQRIQAWCLENIGAVLPVTNQKDYSMVELWDDRAVQVIPNTGEPVDGVRKVYKHTLLRKRSLQVIQAQAGMEHAIAKFLKQTGDRLAAKVRGAAKITKAEMVFGEGAPGAVLWFHKADEPTAEQLLKKLLPIAWAPLLEELEPYMDEIAVAGGVQALGGLNITNQDVISAVNEAASTWAKKRAAEMVGMKWVDDELVENDNPKWAISSTTRDDIRELVTNAFEERTSIKELADSIQHAGTFSASRAKMIAATEGSRAQQQGNLSGWKGSGVVKTVELLLSEDHDVPDECDDVAEAGPYELDNTPDVPVHPNCFCVLNVAELTDD